MKKEIIVVMIAMMLVLPLASASIFDFITGKATSNPTNVDLPVANTGPNITSVAAIDAKDPTESSTSAVTFTFIAYDHDGWADLNTATAAAKFTKIGEATRSGGCTQVGGNVSRKELNFTCTVDMQYYDAAGNWTINVSVSDMSAVITSDSSASFTYNSLTAFTMAPDTLTWAAIPPGATNQASNNDPTVLSNTGNYVSDDVEISATNLTGEIEPTKIGADLFVANVADSCSGGNALVDASYVNITSATLPRGATAQEQIYYCLTLMPPEMTKQTYSTVAEGAWTLQIK
jgi:hypothetical protein